MVTIDRIDDLGNLLLKSFFEGPASGNAHSEFSMVDELVNFDVVMETAWAIFQTVLNHNYFFLDSYTHSDRSVVVGINTERSTPSS